MTSRIYTYRATIANNGNVASTRSSSVTGGESPFSYVSAGRVVGALHDRGASYVHVAGSRARGTIDITPGQRFPPGTFPIEGEVITRRQTRR